MPKGSLRGNRIKVAENEKKIRAEVRGKFWGLTFLLSGKNVKNTPALGGKPWGGKGQKPGGLLFPKTKLGVPRVRLRIGSQSGS